MKLRFAYSPALFALVVLSGASAASAAPTDTLLPAAQAKVLTPAAKAPAVLAITPASAKIIVPVSKPHLFAKRSMDYRYSNPSRWNSDATASSIRNQ